MKSYKIPISVKGIILENGKIWLRKNERQEWELPGGKLDNGEQPHEAIIRELKEELGMECQIIKLVIAGVVKIEKSIDESNGVLLLIYHCRIRHQTGEFELDSEGGKAEFKLTPIEKISTQKILPVYQSAIQQVSMQTL